ncbi:UPF0175 family protein [Spirulina sp. CS-785/01]|uniref:UPF0175 family protein n=1 Tax=Spirulina sp. CS-785/01 TaxID=3021716 RepID=UPI00232BEBF2|nr:UPF0175 family protein [Spirulina sp. CS-785/01]MDB9311787.1 UPF0175 family protein [Spirulina sp. CS-785/01]
MQITINLPEEIGQELEAKLGNLSQQMLEALAVESYRKGVLTSAQVQSLLNLPSRWETEAFLQRSQAYLNYTETDFEKDINTLNYVLSE